MNNLMATMHDRGVRQLVARRVTRTSTIFANLKKL
jgi:hypothetical protein